MKDYISLTKPGIISGNAITAAAGFFLASKGHINYWLFFAVLTGLSLIVASGCVLNNYIDRDIDKLMSRTKNRILAKGMLPGKNAIIYAIILGLSGTMILILYTNLLTAFLALTGFFFYVVLYGLGKRRSSYGTVIGSISGAVPPVVGYCAVSNRFDTGAILLFLILVFWQMPHFYAIAIYRLHDYAAASIPVLPVVKGIFITKIHILVYILFFIVVTLLLTVTGYTGYLYLISAIILDLTWFGFAIKGFWINNDKAWARKMFVLSLIVITLLSILIALGRSF